MLSRRVYCTYTQYKLAQIATYSYQSFNPVYHFIPFRSSHKKLYWSILALAQNSYPPRKGNFSAFCYPLSNCTQLLPTVPIELICCNRVTVPDLTSRERAQLLTVIKLQHKQLVAGSSSTTDVSASSDYRNNKTDDLLSCTTITCEDCHSRSRSTFTPPTSLQPPPPPPSLFSAASLGGVTDAAPRTVTASDSTISDGGVADAWRSSLPGGDNDSIRSAAAACAADDDGGGGELDGSVFSTLERTQLFCKVERQREEVKATAAAAAVAAAAAAAAVATPARLLEDRGGGGGGDDDDTTENWVTRRRRRVTAATAKQTVAAAPLLLATAVPQEPAGVLSSSRPRSGVGGGDTGLLRQGNGGGTAVDIVPRAAAGRWATGVSESSWNEDDGILAAAMMKTKKSIESSCPLATRADGVDGRLQVRVCHQLTVPRRYWCAVLLYVLTYYCWDTCHFMLEMVFTGIGIEGYDMI